MPNHHFAVGWQLSRFIAQCIKHPCAPGGRITRRGDIPLRVHLSEICHRDFERVSTRRYFVRRNHVPYAKGSNEKQPNQRGNKAHRHNNRTDIDNFVARDEVAGNAYVAARDVDAARLVALARQPTR